MANTIPRWVRCSQPLPWIVMTLCLWVPLSGQSADDETRASAADSDPRLLAWMQGFPPAPESRITQPFTQFWPFPKLRWSVCHMRELLPTAAIRRHITEVTPLPLAFDSSLAQLPVPQDGTPQTLPLNEMLDATYTDGLLVLHKGKLVYEHYSGCLDSVGEHATMSMTKSVLGLLIEMLMVEGILDDQQLITDWVPELKVSAFAGATLRDALDMTTAVAFDEDYSNPDSDLWRYARATDSLPKPADYSGVTGNLEFLTTLKGLSGTHGQQFHYSTLNSDVMGWVASRATNTSAATLFSEQIWQPMGAQQDAALKVDAYGIGHVGGGLQANMRDLGRLGLAILQASRVSDTTAFNTAARNIVFGIDNSVSVTGPNAAFWHGYRSFWWYRGEDSPVVAARGVHGQILYIDPDADMVLVRLASSPDASNAKTDPTMMPIYEAIGAYLAAQ